MLAITKPEPRSKRHVYSNAAEARQARRTENGTNSGRQRPRYNDGILGNGINESALLAFSLRSATEVRAFDLHQTVMVMQGPVYERPIIAAWTNGRGEWMYDVQGIMRPVSQRELLTQVLPADYAAAEIAAERDALLSLKRGSRRRDTRLNQ